ncbi:uncharacterized protein RCC_10068 [Ramularia collo-cygni]|uniref:SAP domain-containing protein n=1 Tax=Ramularia collo-cygni TaxID=112498 RepID=A0A2D3VES9_9PEZI|nr:uncharacterized protein RCC_10068 [Ramularia collo-cygni]CZT24345.1 uncharacterized protein RCC_10068 [Ramularia collo-cygni]
MTDYSKLKVAELKELVKERGIVAPGLKLKQQFIDALTAADDGTTGEEAETEQAQDEMVVDGGEAAGNVETQEEVKEVQAAAKVEEADTAAVENGNGTAVEEVDDSKPEGDAPVDDKADEPMNDVPETDHKQEQEQEPEPEAEADAESNKRKRRSPTPPLREESVSKKIKTAQDEPAMPDTSRDDMDVEKDEGAEDARTKTLSSQPTEDAFMSDVTSTAPSQHSATRALYVRNLVRPLQPNVLREHLLAVASPPSSDIDASTVEEFHLDKLRSHALVLFSSISAASRARSALHDQVWPPEPMRKPLFADFFPDEKFQEWVDLETSRERDNLRWEVTYTPATTEDGSHTVTASLQEVSATRQPTHNQMRNDGPTPTGPRASLAGEGMPNAPSGPRTAPTPQPQIPEPTQSKSFTTLDASYKFSETKPKLYWQPVDPELVAKRLEELERGTSEAWDGNMATGELRRYTFEDGDKIVDGGVDWGKFGGGGHHAGPPPRRGGGRDFGGRGRRGGGGGYRGGGGYGGGGGGGYRGDTYRGGGAPARW